MEEDWRLLGAGEKGTGASASGFELPASLKEIPTDYY
jgi:hypothetical protein